METKDIIRELRAKNKAYLVLKEKEDEHAEETLEQCDNFFYENEAVLNELLEKYAKTIEL